MNPTNNNDHVKNLLDLLRQGLGPFVLREYKNVFKNRYLKEIEQALTTGAYSPKHFPDEDAALHEIDTQGWLNLIIRRWDVFKGKLGHTERAYVSEMLEMRNSWGHQKLLTDRDTYRAADTTHRLLKVVGASDQAKVASEMARLLAPKLYHKSDQRTDFYAHIPLPLHYIARSELFESLRQALLDKRQSAEQLPAVMALHGMGGIGKSIMARALCDDPAVQTAFPHGILWTTLGEAVTESDLIRKLSEWIRALGGHISESAPSADALKLQLKQQLQERPCLLVLDDVWHKKDAEAFSIGSPACRALITVNTVLRCPQIAGIECHFNAGRQVPQLPV